jgi:PAS domain S-box-containing protein
LRALILAPGGRDGAIARAVLEEIGIAGHVVASLRDLVAELDTPHGAGAAIIADEAMLVADLTALTSWVKEQPPWSDFPFIVITHHGGGLERHPIAARLSDALGNVSLLERPFHPTTLVSMTRAAIRTRRRQYEARAKLQELAASEERLRAAQEIGNIGDWSWNLKTNVLSWSESTFRMHGLEPGAAAPTFDAWLETVHADDRARIKEEIQAATSGAAAYDTQLRVQHPSGEVRWLQARGRPWRGDPNIFMGTSIDITKLKKAETALALANETLATAVLERTQALAQSEARFRVMFDSGVQLKGLIDVEGAVLIANQTALDAVGVKLEDVLSKPLWDSPWFARSHGEAERLRFEIRRAAAGNPVRYELKLLFPDEQVHIFDFSMKPVRDNSGAVAQIIVEGHDISEMRRTEAALLQAQKLDVLGQITGGVAHDFNNLLMAVIGNLDLLSRHCAGDPRAEHLLAGAMQGAKRGATLTQRLLSFARKQDLHAMPVDLASLLDGMKDLLARSVGPMIDVRVFAAPNLPAAMVDPHQLELAILNLAVNARDAMPSGGRLTINVDQTLLGAAGALAQGTYLRLTVTDTGIGMDAATLERAIEPFFSTKDVGKGTGLGLSMAHGLAVQSGGSFALRSAPNQGTTAEMLLPASQQAPAAVEQPKAAGKRTDPMRILVVDDDALIAMSTADMLQDLGHTVIEAHSGARALEVLRDGQDIGLMITDYAMPGMTGVQLAKAARAIRPDLPVLLATGYADLPDGSNVDFPRLAKPFMQEQLAVQISRAVSR